MYKTILFSLFTGLLLFSAKVLFSDSEAKPEVAVTGVLNNEIQQKMSKRIAIVKELISHNAKYNNRTAFFIDMGIWSGKNRFFVYDFQKNKIVDQGLVAHGSGSETGIGGKLKFSNANNSLCTALGKYYIGNSYEGQFGKAYRLYGLDKTNSNAFLRNIVLHKYSKVPYEAQKGFICNSYGCPMINEKYYKRIEKIIDTSEKSIILDIYY